MTGDVIDLAIYEELKEAAGDDFVDELVAAFLEEAPGMFAALHAALDTGDVDAFRRAAHSLKSNAQVFGANALAEPARDLELMEFAEAAPEMQARLTTLEAEFARTSDALIGLQNG